MQEYEVNAVANKLEEACRINRKISQSTKEYWVNIAKVAIEELDRVRQDHMTDEQQPEGQALVRSEQGQA